MPVYKDISSAIGRTPLVQLDRLAREHKALARVLVKIESMNPLGSVKDRIGISMIEDAEQKGLIQPGKTILVEPTSGNTGIALAFVAAARGYELILTMPETMSLERRKMLATLGATIVLTPGPSGMKGAVARAQEIVATTAGAYCLGQFSNPANPLAHRKTTAPEILADCPDLDIFVAGVGTGGTITGVGQVLKQHRADIQIIAVEPADSPVLTQTLSGQPVVPGPHKIQGIGAGFVPEVLDLSVIDRVITVTNDQALETGRLLPRLEGILAGISSGANIYAALQLAALPENKDKTIVTVACSTGERYLSTVLFDQPENI